MQNLPTAWSESTHRIVGRPLTSSTGSRSVPTSHLKRLASSVIPISHLLDTSAKYANRYVLFHICVRCPLINDQSEHYIRLCPRKDQRNADGNKVPPADYVCKVCSAQGTHFIRDCPVVKERDSEKSKKKDLGPAECRLKYILDSLDAADIVRLVLLE